MSHIFLMNHGLEEDETVLIEFTEEVEEIKGAMFGNKIIVDFSDGRTVLCDYIYFE